MHLGRQRADELITGQVRAVAALMRVTEATARSYLGDEIIKDMARRMLFEVAGERPGAGLMEVRGPFRCRWPSRGSPSRPWPRQCRYRSRVRSPPLRHGPGLEPTSVTHGTMRPMLDRLVFVQHTRQCDGSSGGQATPRESSAILTVQP
jgi:hypothetical protein